MVILINLSVKFRAAGITFGQFTKSWKLPVPVSVAIHSIRFEKQGVKLEVSIVDA